MVLRLDGNSCFARIKKKKVFTEEEKNIFVTALDLIKCLKSNNIDCIKMRVGFL